MAFMHPTISVMNNSSQLSSSLSANFASSNSNIHSSSSSNKNSYPDFPWTDPYIMNPPSPKGYLPLPQYFRSISSIFPETPECYHQCQIPLGIVVNPGSISQAPVVNYYKDIDSIPHCSFCSSYLCPQCKITTTNGLHSWSCAICGKANAFPTITNPNFNIPFDNLIELSNSVYDVIAPLRYYNMNSQSAFAFVIDMSYSAFSTGFTRQFLTAIQNLIDSIPMNSRVCILTMSDTLSIFDLRKCREIIIPDLYGICLAVNQDSLFPPLNECKQSFKTIIKLLLSRVPSNENSGNCLLSAVSIMKMIMKDVGGIAVVNCVNLPKEGPFSLKHRTGNSELDLLKLPDTDSGYAFQEEAIRLNESGISVHLFCSHETEKSAAQNCDIPTIGILSQLTNGKCHFYNTFDDNQRKNLNNDLFETLSGRYLWDSSLHVRHSYGIQLKSIHSNCILKNNKNSVSFPILSKNSTIVFEFDVVKPILQSNVLFQVALYFSTNEGQRIIRVFTFVIPKSKDPRIIWKSIDEAALTTVLTRQAIMFTFSEGPQIACSRIKNEIRRIFSNGMKFVSFLYLSNSLICSRILSNIHPLGVDGRMVTLIELNEISIIDVLLFLYPRLFLVDESKFSILPLRKSSLLNGSCFLFHTYNKIFVWIKKSSSSSYLKNAFGFDSIEKVQSEVPKLETQENKILHQLINNCWSFSGHFLQTEIICEGNPRESIFSEFLVDDNRSLQELMKEINFH